MYRAIALAAGDAFVVSAALAGAMKDETFDLILTGLQSDDQGFGQTGVVLAERLGLPHATIIMDVQVSAGPPATLRVKRELEAGWFQWVGMPLPAILTIQSGINQLRYATLKGIMAAKKKEIHVAAPEPSPRQNSASSRSMRPRKARRPNSSGFARGSCEGAGTESFTKTRGQVRREPS